MSVLPDIERATTLLYPPGRAFRVPDRGDLKKFHTAVNTEYDNLDAGSMNVLDALLPDNPNFTIDDAHDWYRRLGLFDSGSIPFNDMKQAITQKMSWPTVPQDMQSLDYIQDQLQAAGFNVYLYRNKFSDGMGGFETRSPSQVLGVNNVRAVMGFTQYGQTQYGQLSGALQVSQIVDYLEEEKDQVFDTGDNLRSTFYVAANTINNFATVLASRKIEFRQLLLKLKAAQMCGFLFVRYV